MEYKDGQPMRDKVHIVLTGPDGKIKDERNIQEATNEDNERHGV